MIENLLPVLERFGLPTFLIILFCIFFWRVWVFFSKMIETKDQHFVEYVKAQDLRFDRLEEKHNLSFRENTLAVNRLTRAIEKGLQIEEKLIEAAETRSKVEKK